LIRSSSRFIDATTGAKSLTIRKRPLSWMRPIPAVAVESGERALRARVGSTVSRTRNVVVT
jgi:hypothetical protein